MSTKIECPYRIQVTYHENGYEVARSLNPQKTEEDAFSFAAKALLANKVEGATVWVRKDSNNFWKVLDAQGRFIHRPVCKGELL